eukprot:1212014-Pyramimonas_sp.AAC.1
MLQSVRVCMVYMATSGLVSWHCTQQAIIRPPCRPIRKPMQRDRAASVRDPGLVATSIVSFVLLQGVMRGVVFIPSLSSVERGR